MKASVEPIRRTAKVSPSGLLDSVDATDPRSAELVRSILSLESQANDRKLKNKLLRQLIVAYADSQKTLTRLNRELVRRQEEIDRDLEAAAGIQRSLLPESAPLLPNLEVAWRFVPCDRVGGDIFNLFMLDEHHAGIYMLDVSGHGVPAALLTVSVYQAMQPAGSETIKRRLDRPPYYEIVAPGEVLETLNRQYPFERFEKYLSIFYLVLDVHTGRLTYSNGGHPPPVLARRDGTVSVLDQGGAIIGIETAATFETGSVTLEAGDRLVLYTDGVTEHSRKEGEPFSLERLVEMIQTGGIGSLEAMLSNIFTALVDFDPGQSPADDLSLLAAAFEPSGRNPQKGPL